MTKERKTFSPFFCTLGKQQLVLTMMMMRVMITNEKMKRRKKTVCARLYIYSKIDRRKKKRAGEKEE
jgi:hypothetical protein